MFSMAMWMATLVAPIQILAGDQHGLNTLEHQPAKVMAMEGHYQSHPRRRAADPVRPARSGRGQGEIRHRDPKTVVADPKHSLDAPLAGLDTVPRENWPPVPIMFWSFRIMVGLGFLMLGLGLFSLWMRWRGTLYQSRLLHMFALAMGPAGFIAVLAGWITTEVGRQPFTVYGLLRTADSASPLAAPAVASSLIAFVIVYFIVFAAGLTYMFRLMAQPPHHGEQGPRGDVPARAAGITPAAGAAAKGRRLMTGIVDLATIWAFIIAFAVFVYVVMDGFDLGLGILFPLFPEQSRSRRHHEQRRAGLGRQRNLAGARRRRLDGGVSAGLCGADAGAVHADHRDADRPDLSRRRLRIPLAHDASERNRWDIAFAGGSLLAALAQGIALGAILQGVHVEGRALCRRLVGLADAVQHPDRRRAGRRLRAARRDLAGDEDRGRACATRPIA